MNALEPCLDMDIPELQPPKSDGQKAIPNHRHRGVRKRKHPTLIAWLYLSERICNYGKLDNIFTKRQHEGSVFKRLFIENISHLNEYVPLSKRVYLDKHFPSWVIKIPSLRHLAEELHEAGACFLGDVVQLTREDLIGGFHATAKNIEILEARLTSIGLSLGMKAPGWKPNRSPTIQRYE